MRAFARHPLRPLWAVILLCHAPLMPAQEMIEVISLQHRLAAELEPTLEPFLDAGGVVTAQGNQLIIRSNLENMAELKALIEQLDRPRQRLLIEVRQPLVGSRAAQESNLDGQARDNGGGVQIERHRTASRDDAPQAQRIEVLSGHRALIQTGQQVPMAKRQLRDGRAETVIEHQDVSSGFSVVPHLSGDNRVLLEIAPYSADLDSAGGGRINRQQVYTTVSGRLGEWLEIAGSPEREDSERHSTHNRNEQQRRVLIRVTRRE